MQSLLDRLVVLQHWVTMQLLAFPKAAPPLLLPLNFSFRKFGFRDSSQLQNVI